MVEHPAEYPWSSYRTNALGEPSELLSSHFLYEALGKTPSDRQAAYRGLFDSHIPKETIKEIRDMTNKSWVLGSDYFKQKIQAQIDRPVSPRPTGGDRKSADYTRISGV